MDKKEFLDEVIDAIVGIEYSMENEEYVEAGFHLGKLYQMCLTERETTEEDVTSLLTTPRTTSTMPSQNEVLCNIPAEGITIFPQTTGASATSTGSVHESDHTAYVPEHIEPVGESTNVDIADVPTTEIIPIASDVPTDSAPAMNPPTHPDKPSKETVENEAICDNVAKDDAVYHSLDEMPTETLVERLKELPPDVLAKVEELAKRMSNRWEDLKLRFEVWRERRHDD